ncbi:MAG: hypothetical protein LBE60_12375 [Microbacterium sp.]|uniref:hypothetical protein n=1 Tax=Microbacterium sp. TaxID=51671 RepID=UPI00283A5B4B|nr:hypothetical protein [Microbacterium sp.]MDR2322431.1 hypothetical protein [Microbacterium sp.]
MVEAARPQRSAQAVIIESRIAMHASMQALHAAAHIRHTSLCASCFMHMSMQSWHIAMHASSIDIITAGVIPCGRIMARIMVLHMSAQFMQAGEQSIICVAHTVQACSQAEQASMHACMSAMSIACIPGIMSMLFIESIIIASISRSFGHRGRRANGPSDAQGSPASPSRRCPTPELVVVALHRP